MDGTTATLQTEIVDAIRRYVAESLENRYIALDGSSIYEEPLVGFADGDDPLFAEFKRVACEFQLTPREAMQMHFDPAGDEEPASRLSVISFVLPASEVTRLSNRPMTYGPSVRWNHLRWYGEEFITGLKKHLVALLSERGYRAVSPSLEPFFKNFALPNGKSSSWSERHVAYAAGLGTFGLTDALITAKGVAHRLGSVVIEAALAPTLRPYTNHRAYCPFINDGSCGVCIDRCPAGAVSVSGHDKIRCSEHLDVLKKWQAERASEGYTGAYIGCGLCMTGVPCEAGMPV